MSFDRGLGDGFAFLNQVGRGGALRGGAVGRGGKEDLVINYSFVVWCAVFRSVQDCLNAISKHFHPECFNCVHCGKLFGNSPFFLEDGHPYCETGESSIYEGTKQYPHSRGEPRLVCGEREALRPRCNHLTYNPG